MVKKFLIVGVNGSPHKNGHTVGMLKEVLKNVEKYGGRSKIIHLTDYKMKTHHGDYSKKVDNESIKIFDILLKADGIVLATPVHWQGSSSLMKIFVDNLTYLESSNFQLGGKVVGFVAHCEEDGAYHVVSELSGIMNHMGLVTPPFSTVFSNQNIRRNETTEWQWKDTGLLAKNMLLMCKMVEAFKPNWDYGR